MHMQVQFSKVAYRNLIMKCKQLLICKYWFTASPPPLPLLVFFPTLCCITLSLLVWMLISILITSGTRMGAAIIFEHGDDVDPFSDTCKHKANGLLSKDAI